MLHEGVRTDVVEHLDCCVVLKSSNTSVAKLGFLCMHQTALLFFNSMNHCDT